MGRNLCAQNLWLRYGLCLIQFQFNFSLGTGRYSHYVELDRYIGYFDNWIHLVTKNITSVLPPPLKTFACFSLYVSCPIGCAIFDSERPYWLTADIWASVSIQRLYNDFLQFPLSCWCWWSVESGCYHTNDMYPCRPSVLPSHVLLWLRITCVHNSGFGWVGGFFIKDVCVEHTFVY